MMRYPMGWFVNRSLLLKGSFPSKIVMEICFIIIIRFRYIGKTAFFVHIFGIYFARIIILRRSFQNAFKVLMQPWRTACSDLSVKLCTDLTDSRCLCRHRDARKDIGVQDFGIPTSCGRQALWLHPVNPLPHFVIPQIHMICSETLGIRHQGNPPNHPAEFE